MIKIGILGMGGMGWFHASKLFQLPNVKLAAVADVTPDRLEAKHAVQINIAGDNRAVDLAEVARFSDASQLIAQADVDVIDVCLPSYLHARYAVEALQAGRHVLCEKPMALTVDEADRMVAAARRAGRTLMIAQCIRFWPEYQFLRDCVRDGRFGKLLSLNTYRMGGRPIWSWQNWFLDPARSGGPVIDLHIHDVDFVHYLLGKPDTVYATARKSDATGTYDVVHTVFTYEAGSQVHLHAGWSLAQTPFLAGYDAWFERGFVRLDPRLDPAVTVYADPVKANGQPAEYVKGDAYFNEIAYYVNCIETGAPPAECPPESARDSLWLARLAIESVESGQVISTTSTSTST